MTKLIRYAFAVLGALVISTAFASQKNNTNSNKNVTKDSTVHYMFVVSAKTGVIKHFSKNHYQLTLKVPNVHQVLMFSDRPYRFTSYITGNALKVFWKKGNNNFKQDPPNAVLSSYRLYPTITILHRYENHGDYITFDFYSTQTINLKTLNHLTLTIDSIATISDVTQGAQIKEAAQKKETCDTVSSVALSGSLVATGLAFAVSAIACDGDSGIKYVFDSGSSSSKSSSSSSKVDTINSVTNKDGATVKADEEKEADASTACKDVTNFAGNVESMESPIGDLASVIACGNGSPLVQTTAKKYSDL